MALTPTEYTAQNLEYAVSVFYNGEQAERAQAHSWLTAAQRAPNAWQFVWELLQPNKGTEIQFYAATTLHTKILRCWHELPPETYEELKHKLLEAIFAYANGPKIVTNRLCISLAAFILQQGSKDLVSILTPLSTPENTALLLEVLTVIPEEYNSMTMGSCLRSKNRVALHRACPMVLDDMLRQLQSVYNDYTAQGPPEATVKAWLRAVTCACSWLTLGGDEAELTGTMPERMPLVRTLITIVRVLYNYSECVSGTALDCCEACLAGVRAAGAGADAARYPAAAKALIGDLVDMARPIMARENVPNSINEELLSALITCLVSITECHTKAVVEAAEEEPPGPARELVALLLAAQMAPGYYPVHETRSALLFGVWFTLQEELLQDIEYVAGPQPMWMDVYMRVLTTLIVKSEVYDEDLTKDDQELLRCYRQDIADTAMYCYFIVGDMCWAAIERAYREATTDARREAALHALHALADAAPDNRAPCSLLSLLEEAVAAAAIATDVRTLTTALDAVGSYASWLSIEAVAETEEGAAVAREAVRVVGASLGKAPRAAALALRRLTTDCSAPAAELVTDIVSAAQSEAVRADSWVRRQLMTACGNALVAAPHDVAAPLLQQLASGLQGDLQQQVLEPQHVTGAAECAAGLLASLARSPELTQVVLRVVLPALPAFTNHTQLVEPMFSVVNQILCTVEVESVLEEVVQIVLAGFHCQPCASGLDVVKLLLLITGPEWSPTLGPLLHGVVSAAALVVARGPSAAADLAEGLFKLLHNITRKRPAYLDAITDLLEQIVDLACNCVRLWEAGAARASCVWLASLCEARPEALRPVAPMLTAAALRCIGGATPRNQIEPLAELLLALNRVPWDGGATSLAVWLRQALAVPGFPTPHATDEFKDRFIASVIKEKSSKRRVIEYVQEFSLACRGLLGTEYGRQALLSRILVG